MKKFLLGYFIGGLVGYIGGDYMARTEIFMKLTNRRSDL